ncbi:MAG: hypothetical protein PHH37_01305 [Paludibacter sp.]|nr:hypothetical protein [Paludibacter sp.]
MKKQIFNVIAMLVVAFSLTMVSCTDNGNDTKTGAAALIEQGILYGELDGTATLDASVTYKLTGTLIVKSGAILNIPAGTRIEASEGFGSYIIVAQGGKININGTSEKPVVMTADDEANANSGYWGGLILNGYAKISSASASEGTATSKCEMNDKFVYGGNDDTDNSGTITYLMIKYAGARSSAEVEHNGLTLDAVGSGTTIENVYILESADDGVECFGGTVALKNFLVVNDDDDCFDNTQGYRGSWTNMYGIWESGYTSSESDPRGVESDGNLDGKTPNDINQTDFTITNMTIDLQLDSVNSTIDQSKFMQDIIKIRRGAKVNVSNALVKGVGSAQDLIDMTDSKGFGDVNSSISLTNSLTYPILGVDVRTSGKLADGTTQTWSYPNVTAAATGNTGCASSIFAWTGYTGF